MRLAVAFTAILITPIIATVPVRAQALSPDGSGCEGAISRWQAFAAQESQGGHMDDSVYNKIKTEIEQATELCRSGQDAKAVRIVETSKRLHGY